MPDIPPHYPVFQGQLSHENDNLNQRLFWYVFAQSFLFGAYAAIVNAPQAAKSPLFARQQDLLLWLLPVTALVISVLIYPSILISLRYMSELRRKFETLIGPEADDLPPIHGNPALRWMADSVYRLLPPALEVGS